MAKSIMIQGYEYAKGESIIINMPQGVKCYIGDITARA